MDAQNVTAVRDAPDVQIVNARHPLHARNGVEDFLPVHPRRDFLEQDREAGSNHADGGVAHEDREYEGANWIRQLPRRLHVNDQSRKENHDRLGQIRQHVQIGRVQIYVALLFMTFALDRVAVSFC